MVENRNIPTRFGLQMSPAQWSNFRFDFAAAVLFSVFNVVFNQFYLPMAIQQGASNIQVGLLSAAPAIGLMFSPLWASWIERAPNPLPFTVWPNVVGRALIVLPAFYGTPWVYVATALAFHMLMGIHAPAYASLMTHIYPAPLRGRLMGYVRVAMGLLMIPIAYAIGLWTDLSGPTGPLLVASATGLASIAMFLGLRTTEPVAERRTRKRATFKEQWSVVKENRPLSLFLVATTFSGFGNLLVQPLYQIIQVEHLQLSNVEIGYARIAYFAFLIVGFLVVGWAVDRYPPERTLTIGLAAPGVGALLYGVFGNYPAVLVASGIQGVGDSIWDIGILTYIFKIAPGREAVVFGLHLLLFGVRGTIGPLLSTSLSGAVPMAALLLFAAACGLIGAALFHAGSRARVASAS